MGSEMCIRDRRQTDHTTLLRHPSLKGYTWRPLPTPWQVNSGTEPNDETNQDSKPPMKILTAATRNLGISRFLCEYSGPFGGMFSYIRLDMLSKVPVGAKCLSLVRIPRNLLTTPSLLVQSIPYMHTRECLLCIEYL